MIHVDDVRLVCKWSAIARGNSSIWAYKHSPHQQTLNHCVAAIKTITLWSQFVSCWPANRAVVFGHGLWLSLRIDPSSWPWTSSPS